MADGNLGKLWGSSDGKSLDWKCFNKFNVILKQEKSL